MAVKTVKVYCRSSHVILEDSYGEDGPYTGYTHEAYEDHHVTFEGDPLFIEETYQTELDDPYLVYVIYSSGGTFGRTDGYFRSLGLFTEEDALLVKKLVERSSELSERRSGIQEKELVDRKLSFYGIDYDFWNGYFESLQEVVIKRVYD